MSNKVTTVCIAKTHSGWLDELIEEENTTKREYLEQLIYRDYIIHQSRQGKHIRAGRLISEYDFGMNSDLADEIFFGEEHSD